MFVTNNQFPENHIADSICEKLQEKLSNFHLRLHDQGSNMRACARHIKGEFGWEKH